MDKFRVTPIAYDGKRMRSYELDTSTAEIAVRCDMCWHNFGTLFLVENLTTKQADWFRKIRSVHVAVADLEKLNEQDILNILYRTTH